MGTSTTNQYSAAANVDTSSTPGQASLPNVLTTTGNEITDATRSANVQGDGRSAPDSSTGIWRGTTNVVTNGGFENGVLNGWTPAYSTVTKDSSQAKFGSASAKVVTPGTHTVEGLYWINGGPITGVTSGQIWTYSVWVKAPAGANMLMELVPRQGNANIPGTVAKYFTGTGAWQRHT